jgi:hypothetical protein
VHRQVAYFSLDSRLEHLPIVFIIGRIAKVRPALIAPADYVGAGTRIMGVASCHTENVHHAISVVNTSCLTPLLQARDDGIRFGEPSCLHTS